MKINEILKPKLTHKERVLKTKNFIGKNKVFYRSYGGFALCNALYFCCE
jgi:hypothetical protein